MRFEQKFKSQLPNPKEASNTKLQNAAGLIFCILDIGVFPGAWNLVLGVSGVRRRGAVAGTENNQTVPVRLEFGAIIVGHFRR